MKLTLRLKSSSHLLMHKVDSRQRTLSTVLWRARLPCPPRACSLLTDTCSCLADGEKSTTRDVIPMDTLGPGECRYIGKSSGKRTGEDHLVSWCNPG